MKKSELMDLAGKIEALSVYDAGLTRRAFDLVAIKFPELDRAMIEAGALGSIDAALLLIDHGLPGWSLSMDGIASETNGYWKCTLRRSSVRDNDAFLGIGSGPRLSNVLIAALLKALAFEPET